MRVISALWKGGSGILSFWEIIACKNESCPESSHEIDVPACRVKCVATHWDLYWKQVKKSQKSGIIYIHLVTMWHSFLSSIAAHWQDLQSRSILGSCGEEIWQPLCWTKIFMVILPVWGTVSGWLNLQFVSSSPASCTTCVLHCCQHFNTHAHTHNDDVVDMMTY